MAYQLNKQSVYFFSTLLREQREGLKCSKWDILDNLFELPDLKVNEVVWMLFSTDFIIRMMGEYLIHHLQYNSQRDSII